MAKGYFGEGMGRPPIEWDKRKVDLFNVLMGIPFVTEKAVAEALGVGISSLVQFVKDNYDGMTFQELKAQKQEGMKMKLAGKQYEQAMKGNTAMLIWLGKQWLGQKEKQEISSDPQNPVQQITLNYVPKSQRDDK